VTAKDEKTRRIEVTFAPKSAQMGELESVPLYVEQ
jgi:hypothetical protein